MELSADLESQLVESIRGVMDIKAFVMEKYFYNRLQKISNQLLSSIYRASRDFTLSSHFSELIASTWLILILWLGSRQIIHAKLSYGELFSFYALYSYISHPLIKLILSNRGIQDAKIAAERLFQVMDLQAENTTDQIKIETEIKKPVEIVIERVSFNFPGQLDLLKEISFECNPGKIIAIIGDNGSGKSTLLANLMGFYQPGSGKITFNNINIKHIPLYELRRQFSWVPQTISLFSGSLGENISFERKKWNSGKINRAIELAGLNSLVNKLPDGLDTYISEDGTTLSGGEKQKIAFARAVYRDAPVFLMDEPSASMDSSSEKKLYASLEFLKQQKKSIIVVAHKLSMIYPADQILVLHEGKIIEKGDHTSLLNTSSHYKKLWSEQNICIT